MSRSLMLVVDDDRNVRTVRPETAHIPIICLSAGLARSIRDGMIADEWQGKPFSSGQFAECLARWVEALTGPAHSQPAN